MTAYNSSFNGALPFSDVGAQFNLATNTALSFTVPGTNTTTYRAEFSYAANSNVWIGYNVTAVAPTSGTYSSTYKQEFRPGIRFVRGGDVLSAVSSDATGAQVGVSLLQLP
jgi:hypothetical protein